MDKPYAMPKAGDLKVKYKTPGGNEGAGAVARTNATNAAIYANAQNAITYQRDVQNYASGELEDDLVRGIKEKQNAQQYSSLMQQRDIQISGQLEAYKRNSESIADQLKLNRLAAVKAGDENKTILKDRLQQEDFKNQTLNLTRDRDLISSQNAFDTADQGRVNAENKYNQSTATSRFDSANKIDALEFNTSERQSALFDTIDSERSRRDALTRKSSRDASASQYDVDQVNRAEDRFLSENFYDYNALERTKERYDSQKDFEKSMALNNFENVRAQRMFEKQGRMLEAIAQRGQALSKGTRGKSAVKGLQAVTAMAGMDITKLTDSIYRANQTYTLQDTRYTDQKAENTKEYTSQRTRSKKVKAEREVEFASKRTRTQSQLDESQTELQAQFDVSEKREDSARTKYDKNKKRNEDLKAVQEGTLSLALNDAFISKNSANADAEQKKKFIAEQLGLNEKIFSMDREAIGRSMLSAMSSFETGEDNIWLRKYEADMKAYNSRMMKPMFTDAPEEPFKIPKFETIRPARPLEVPRGAVAPRPEAPKQSGLSKVLAIGGMVVGALAAPLTAGGSLVAAAAVAGAGAGLSATSAFV